MDPVGSSQSSEISNFPRKKIQGLFVANGKDVLNIVCNVVKGFIIKRIMQLKDVKFFVLEEVQL